MKAFWRNSPTPGHLCGVSATQDKQSDHLLTYAQEYQPVPTKLAKSIQHDAITDANPNTKPRKSQTLAARDPKQPPS